MRAGAPPFSRPLREGGDFDLGSGDSARAPAIKTEPMAPHQLFVIPNRAESPVRNLL
jgi:hypothetical protein